MKEKRRNKIKKKTKRKILGNGKKNGWKKEAKRNKEEKRIEIKKKKGRKKY